MTLTPAIPRGGAGPATRPASDPAGRVYAIVREAARNAFRHSRARDIAAQITYNASSFQLRIRDDGKGIDPRIVVEGMRERARRIGGKLDVWTAPAAGTEIEFEHPWIDCIRDISLPHRFWPIPYEGSELTIRVLSVDDHPLLLQRNRTLVKAECDVKSGRGSIERTAERTPEHHPCCPCRSKANPAGGRRRTG
jgi:hypothetical protein